MTANREQRKRTRRKWSRRTAHAKQKEADKAAMVKAGTMGAMMATR
jgi:hypothetical protein